MTAEADIAVLIERYAGELAAAGAIRSAAVRRAFSTVPRHRLLETFSYRDETGSHTVEHDPWHPRREDLEIIYADTAMATRRLNGIPTSSTSGSALVARMLELLELGDGMTVLEIGAGTGYNAALLAEIVGDQQRVTTVDVQADVVEQTRRLLSRTGYPQIRVRLGDGFDGVPEHAPFDRIVATVGCGDLSPRWAEQLADGGTMLVPLDHAGEHPLVRLRRDHGTLSGRIAGWTGFMPVRGPLQIEDIWPRGYIVADPGEVARAGELGPRFAPAGSPGLPGEETGFLFFLSLNDRRAFDGPNGPGLNAMSDGWADAGTDGIRWWKDGALARELDRYYQDWDDLGRPGAGDYQVSFVPVGQECDRPAGGWMIERRFYRELVTLDPGRVELRMAV
jgi:protein-L-isoaspartate(D-aspartate) O-methyltransferase